MRSLDGKVAIVSGSGRGIGRQIALKLAAQGAAVVVNDLDVEPAQETVEAIEVRRRPGRAVHRQRDRCRVRRTVRADRGRHLRRPGHHRQQRRIHLGHCRAEDDGRTVGCDSRRASQGAVPDTSCGSAGDFRRRQAASAAGRRCLPQGRQHLVHRRAGRQCGPGQLRGGQGRDHRTDQDVGQGVGTIQRHRQHSRLRADQDPADGGRGRRATPPSTFEGADQGRGQPDLLGTMERSIPLGRAGTPEEAAGAVYLLCTPESNYISAQTLVCGGGFIM